MTSKSQGLDRMGAGKFILDTCIVSGDRKEIYDDVKCLAAASLDAFELLDIYTSELKKK